MKKLLKIVLLALITLLALVLLTVGPLYNIMVKEVAIGEWVLGIVGLNSLFGNYYLQTISAWVSGFIFGFILYYIIKGIKRKQKKNKKGQNKKNGPDGSLKVNFPTPVEQNQHKKNNITF